MAGENTAVSSPPQPCTGRPKGRSMTSAPVIPSTEREARWRATIGRRPFETGRPWANADPLGYVNPWRLSCPAVQSNESDIG
jgi:hypothetical protein